MRARRLAAFVGKFFVWPFEVVETASEAARETQGGAMMAAQQRWRRQLRLRTYQREHADMNEYDETDFWKEHREKQDESYDIPWQNRRPSQSAGKKGSRLKMSTFGSLARVRARGGDDGLERGGEVDRREKEKILV
jgi:hypothetical protein